MTKRIGVYIYENMTMLDVFGPMQFLAFVPDVELVTVAVTENPITTDAGIRVTPNYSVANAPDIDILLVGGSADPSREIADPEVMSWFRKAGEQAEYVTSVCTGALILAEAGLLDGYRATTHWAYVTDFAHYPQITPAEGRVVRDRNRITGGGVTAGIDFALTLISEIADPQTAAAMQLLCEYDPQPGMTCGHPRTAPPELVGAVAEMCGPLRADLDAFYATKG
jgi:transcriptional regulator GlxA family with amidase domain